MPIVTAKEVAEGLNLDKLGIVGTGVGSVLLQVTGISELNRIYEKRKHLGAAELLASVLDRLDVDYDIPEKDLERIPQKGAFITVSNHPLGAIDGMILMKTLIEKRSDYKVLANFMLERLDTLSPYIMPVNPFEDRQNVRSSLAGVRKALLHLQEERPLGIFPAGEVSTTKEGKAIVDRPWLPEVIKIIQTAGVPVIPIYFHGKNSPSFYRLARLNHNLRTARLPTEMLSQYKRPIKVRIGNPIPVKAQKKYTDLDDFSQFLRKKVYMLSSSFDKKSFLKNINIPTRISVLRSPREIAEAISDDRIQKEIDFCRTHDKRLFKGKNYEVFLAEKQEIPGIVQEIGRLREITFRAIGEGTNQAKDLDKFDKFYHHLFLYDNAAHKVVGAYRMGLGRKIFNKYGINGFYIQDLFRVEPELYKMMSQSIEMGRAFITEAYQKKPMPLFYLWKGIVHCTLRFPEHKYLIGGVSISNQFSDFSKSMMIEFMKSHYYDPYVAQFVHPKKEFKVRLKDADKEFVFDESKADLNKFDRIIDELEPGHLRMPVLLKKYLKQNAKVVAFNVDPLFNHSVDGLMYIKIDDLPESTVKPVIEEFQERLERRD